MTQVTMKAQSPAEAAIMEMMAKRWSGQEISYIAPSAKGDAPQTKNSTRPATSPVAQTGQNVNATNG